MNKMSKQEMTDFVVSILDGNHDNLFIAGAGNDKKTANVKKIAQVAFDNLDADDLVFSSLYVRLQGAYKTACRVTTKKASNQDARLEASARVSALLLGVQEASKRNRERIAREIAKGKVLDTL